MTNPFSENDYIEQVRQRKIQQLLNASSWFMPGVAMLDLLREALCTNGDELCWYLPEGALGPHVILGSTLMGLPVRVAPPGSPPGIGIALPI